MTWAEMQIAPIKHSNPRNVAYEYDETLIAPGNGKAILIPDSIRWFSTTMTFTLGASGKIQWTTDLISVVKSGAGITWQDSWWGEADETYMDMYIPIVSAIRIVQILAGTMKVTMRAQ